MEQCKTSYITELQFDRIVAILCKEHDYEDETIAAFGLLRKEIFGRVMADMPEELFLESACEMLRIMKG